MTDLGGLRDDAGRPVDRVAEGSVRDIPPASPARTDRDRRDRQEEAERVAPPTPPGAPQVFGDRLALAERFTALLTASGVSHGLIGPREVPRLWERHVLNCAVIHPAIPVGAMVIDVGSGAGLPGLALAIARPDLDLHLIEPMLRRTTWLSMAVADLELRNVSVHRGRAEEFWGVLSAPVVTARAVAPLGELARWCLPLLRPRGSMLAIRGARVGQELAAGRAVLRRLGAVEEVIEIFGDGLVDPPTTVLRVVLGDRKLDRGVVRKSTSKGRRRG